MIKKLILILSIVSLFTTEILTAQNLLLNPGLENYITCPGFGQFSNTYINEWTKPSIGSTDYYHTACPGIPPTSQVPHGGNAYFGIIAYNYGTEYREYATGHLSSPLIAGVMYNVEFYVSLNDGYIQAVHELGAYFSASVPGPFSNALHIAVTPQVENTSGLLGSDSTWMLVSGSFVALGGEEYVTIGNFRNDASTTVTQVGTSGSFGAYYFVDDISVVPTKITGIESSGESAIGIFPNPFNISAAIILNAELTIKNTELKLYNMLGREVLNFKPQTSNFKLDRGSLESGIYFYKVTGDKGQGTREIISTGKLIVE